MISYESLTSNWIDSVSRRSHKTDKILVEKVIRALFLLEGLVEAGIPFVFKGGTAVMLLLDSTRRLSIDIDIIIDKKLELSPHFEKIIKSKEFIRFENNERKTQSKIKKGSLQVLL